MRRIIALNFLDSFIGAALAVAVPLLMLDRKIDLATIGVVSSILPLVFTSLRVVFASLADQVGVKLFFALDCLASALSSYAYLLSSTGTQFFFGKLTEGLRGASFWAVNRTAIFADVKLVDREREAAFMSSLRTFGIAAGTALAGIGIAYFSFPAVLASLSLLSLLMLIPVLGIRNGISHKPDLKTTLRQLDFRNKQPVLWKASVAMSAYAVANTFILGFIMPIFLRTQLSLDYSAIGFLLALYFLIDASSTFLALRLNLSFPKLALLQTFLFCTGALLLPSASSLPQALLLILLIAAGDGLSAVFFESIVADATRGSPSLSTDIGLLHVPLHITAFLALFSAGFIAQQFGFATVFWLAALAFAICSLLSLAFVRHEKPQAILFSWLLRRRA